MRSLLIIVCIFVAMQCNSQEEKSGGKQSFSIKKDVMSGGKQTFNLKKQEAPPKPEIPEIITDIYYAVLIGVEDYQDKRITDLDEPINDVAKLRNVLINRYSFDQENIIVLENPDKEMIISTLHQLRSKVGAHDNLLLFYAGHGYWDEGMNTGYWLPNDAKWENPSNWLSNTVLTDYLGAIKSKHTLVLSDACFSGSIFKTRRAFNNVLATEKLYELPSRQAMTSGTMKEVPDKSVFIQYLIKKLAENEKKYLSAQELFAVMRDPILNNSPNVPQIGRIQNVGDEGGDFIFVLK